MQQRLTSRVSCERPSRMVTLLFSAYLGGAVKDFHRTGGLEQRRPGRVAARDLSEGRRPRFMVTAHSGAEGHRVNASDYQPATPEDAFVDDGFGLPQAGSVVSVFRHVIAQELGMRG